ncbi:hypothetical protein Nepgr_016523 [Nepenthes gracilis]|uniref:Dof zinc finger protein n=1 Tax=Nepenthes gracilis TaxID=150966 RepID=A0AAD3XRE2_NEPGR|nr:hypothetical protein Nepgr_016523 [Nepenthes gracilis]
MLSSEKLIANSVTEEETHHCSGGSGGGRKTSSPQKPKTVKCPRCDSSNTKFCYYNNYSLTQPRHFCKTCRRYWTKGGALRNIPIGGGRRRSRERKLSSFSCSSRLANDRHSKDQDFKLSPLSDINGGLDHLGSSSSSTSFLGFDYPAPDLTHGGGNGGFSGLTREMALMNGNGSLAASIGSLCSISNHELHWKLQQQRLAMLCAAAAGDGGADVGDNNINNINKNQKETVSSASIVQKPHPFVLQNSEILNSRKYGGAEWFFDSSFSPTPKTDNNNENATTSSFDGVYQAWSTADAHQFNGLP